ncbi:MAG: hypothetical protein AAF492_02085, partial [Verrucomicrobiota bacterium]
KWKTILALAVLFYALYQNWMWPWGLLFIYWTIPAFYAGEVMLVEPIRRKESPVLFWLIVLTWIGLGALMVAMDL